ncbi:MAG: hypothetical protein DMG60_13605 [Acidobacteria bacterium]|nr:MAG: hypothetical protein DMG60_13605 [Acidobacteriota bacterium]
MPGTKWAQRPVWRAKKIRVAIESWLFHDADAFCFFLLCVLPALSTANVVHRSRLAVSISRCTAYTSRYSVIDSCLLLAMAFTALKMNSNRFMFLPYDEGREPRYVRP